MTSLTDSLTNGRNPSLSPSSIDICDCIHRHFILIACRRHPFVVEEEACKGPFLQGVNFTTRIWQTLWDCSYLWALHQSWAGYLLAANPTALKTQHPNNLLANKWAPNKVGPSIGASGQLGTSPCIYMLAVSIGTFSSCSSSRIVSSLRLMQNSWLWRREKRRRQRQRASLPRKQNRLTFCQASGRRTPRMPTSKRQVAKAASFCWNLIL